MVTTTGCSRNSSLELTTRCNEASLTSDDSERIVASLDRKCLGHKAFRESGTSLRGIFDKETRRKPLAFAADALSYGD